MYTPLCLSLPYHLHLHKLHLKLKLLFIHPVKAYYQLEENQRIVYVEKTSKIKPSH